MKRLVIILGMTLVLLTLAVSSAFAGSATISGVVDSSDPVMAVVSISTPNCGVQGATPVHYELHPFTVDASGVYNFSLTSTSDYASMYLYVATFDPTNGAVNCIAGANSGTPKAFSVNLTAGTQYYVIPFDDTFVQAAPAFELTIDGPGNITLGGGASATSDVCTNPRPGGAVIYDVPLGAPAFFAPDLATQLSFNLPAGTWYISEFSGDFAKVWIACTANSIWIPANSVGEPRG